MSEVEMNQMLDRRRSENKPSVSHRRATDSTIVHGLVRTMAKQILSGLGNHRTLPQHYGVGEGSSGVTSGPVIRTKLRPQGTYTESVQCLM